MAYAETEKFGFKMSFTGIEIPLEVLERAVSEEKPMVYFNDRECNYWIFDFSFKWNGKTYWIEMTSNEDPWVYGATMNIYQ